MKQARSLATSRPTWFDGFQKLLATTFTLATLGIITLCGAWFAMEGIVEGTSTGEEIVYTIGITLVTGAIMIGVLWLIWRGSGAR